MTRIEVTQADIDAGKISSWGWNPIALAAARAFGDNIPIRVLQTTMQVGDGRNGSGDRMHSARLPAAARRFRRDFDTGGPVKPFTFEVDLGGES